MPTPLEIECPACGKETLLKREPRYEGFRKVGETLSCASCGHEFADGAVVPTRDGSARPSLFGEDDKPETPRIFHEDDKPELPNIFHEDERQRCCRYCVHYVVNAFVQRCGLHRREVEATDLCEDFERRRDVEDESD